MEQYKEKIEDIQVQIERVADSVYKQDGHEKENVNQLIEIIMPTVDYLFAMKATNPDLAFDENKLLITLQDALKALEDNDMVLLLDILQYELLEQFEQI